MTGKADRRRPLVVAIVLIGAIAAALVAPVMIGARRGEPIPGSIVRADSRDAVTITAPLTLFSSPSVVLQKGTVALVSPTGESRVGALLRALVLGDGADLVLDGARLIVDRKGSSGPAIPAAELVAGVSAELQPVVASLSSFKFRSLAILDSTLVVDTGRGPPEEITIVNVEIAPAGHGFVSAKGQLDYRGEHLNIDVAFELTQQDQPDTPVKVRASVNSELVTASFDGRLSPADHGQITAENAQLSISNLRAFADWLGASWPTGPGLRAVTAKGLLTLEERLVSFEHAEFTLDGNAATGTLMVKLGAERPSVEGTLAFSSFDIAPYNVQTRPYAIALASNWLSAIEIPGLTSPSFLTDMDADIRLSASNVVSGSDRLGRCAASLSVKDGKLYGELAELEFEQGGRGEGQVTVDANGPDPQYTLHTELSDIDLETAVTPHFGSAVIDGSGDIRLDLSASGSSESEITRSLAGKLSLDMSDGVRVGVDLAAFPLAAAAPTPVAGWGAVGNGSTSFSKLTANLTAFRGVLVADTVEATTADRSVTASGAVDIDNKALDLIVSIASPDGASAADPPQAFKIHGPWSAPTITRAGPGKAAGATSPGADPG